MTLAPGESQTVTVPLDQRVLQTYDEAKNGWNLASGDYEVVVGPASDNTPLKGSMQVK